MGLVRRRKSILTLHSLTEKNFFITKFILSDWMNFSFYSFNIPFMYISFNFIIFLYIITFWFCSKEKHVMRHVKITALSFSQLKWTQEILSWFNSYLLIIFIISIYLYTFCSGIWTLDSAGDVAVAPDSCQL